jgi:hypothetical protein
MFMVLMKKSLPILGLIIFTIMMAGCTGAQTVPPSGSGGSNSNYYTPTATPRPQVYLTAVNWYIDYTSTSDYFGPSTQASNGGYTYNAGDQFSYTITLHSSALMFSHTVDSITIQTPGFTLLSVTPQLPSQKVPSGGSISITIKLQTPNYAYTGPLEFRMSTS